MKISSFIILLIAILLICVGSVLAIYYTQVIKYVGYRNMDVKVDKFVGLNVDSDAMHFGVVPPTGWADVKLVLTNTYRHKTQIIISLQGNISGMITLSDNNFILEPWENKTVKFTCTIPANAPLNATYNGRARVVFKRFFD